MVGICGLLLLGCILLRKGWGCSMVRDIDAGDRKSRMKTNLPQDLQNEHSIVGNFPDILMVREFGTEGKFIILPRMNRN